MVVSLFREFVDKYFTKVVGKITEKFNDKSKEEVLLHKSMLIEEYSPDLSWGSTDINHSIVAADVVALDSSIPLKKRGAIEKAIGRLPKIGLKYRKDEKAITDINVMIARGTDEKTIATKLFDDTAKVIKGIDVRNEIMFLQGLSTGVILVTDDENTGTAVRADFGYKAENTFHAITQAWGGQNATPQDDVQQLFDKASAAGNTIGHVYMSKKYFNYFRNSSQGKLLAASYLGQTVVNIQLASVPSRTTFLAALADEYGASFHVIDSTFRVEKNGNVSSVKPWEEPNIIATPTDKVGRLVYGTLAEETNPVQQVSYQKSGTHILVSKYANTDPLEEFTVGQSLSLPVIDGVDGIYILHADGTGKVSTDVDSLSFTSAANTTGKKVTVHADKTWTAAVPAADTWVTLVTSGDKVTVKVSANTGQGATERTSTLTITDADGNTATVTITQAA